jgi:hypothetical protein
MFWAVGNSSHSLGANYDDACGIGVAAPTVIDGEKAPRRAKKGGPDCRGHMTNVIDTQGAGNMPTVYVPPLSVGAKLAAIACAGR